MVRGSRDGETQRDAFAEPDARALEEEAALALLAEALALGDDGLAERELEVQWDGVGDWGPLAVDVAGAEDGLCDEGAVVIWRSALGRWDLVLAGLGFCFEGCAGFACEGDHVRPGGGDGGAGWPAGHLDLELVVVEVWGVMRGAVDEDLVDAGLAARELEGAVFVGEAECEGRSCWGAA